MFLLFLIKLAHFPGCIESDSEYDSELDDFIDDGPQAEEDYSKVITEIFGYDKSKWG